MPSYLAPGIYTEELQGGAQPIAGVGTSVVGLIGIVPPVIYIPVPNPDYDPVAARAALELAAIDAARAALDPSKPEDPTARAASDEMRERSIAELRGAVQGLLGKLTAAKTRQVALNTAFETAKQERDAANAALEPLMTEFENANDADKLAKQPPLDEARRKLSDKETALRRASGRLSTVESEISRLNDEIRETNELLPPESRISTGEPQPGGQVTPVVPPTTRDGTTPESAPAPTPVPPAPEGVAAPETGTPDNTPVGREIAYFKGMDAPDERALAPSILRPYMLQAFRLRADACDTKLCTNFTEYTNRFGWFSAFRDEPRRPPADPDHPDAQDNPENWTYEPLHPGHSALTHAVSGFFKNGGTKAFVARIESVGQLDRVLDNFSSIDEVAIIAAPGLPRVPDTWEKLMTHVEKRVNCFAILDTPEQVCDQNGDLDIEQLTYTGANTLLPRVCKDAALYFPHIEVSDPAKQMQDSDPARRVPAKYQGLTYVPPSGHIAGIYALTDTNRGVHKAPANAIVRDALEVRYYISKPLQEMINPQGVNAIRLMNNAATVWGARTLGGDKNGEWKYINVRRLFQFLRKSIQDGTQWIVFEPNDEKLWAGIVANITAFLKIVWHSGALFGSTQEEAFYVKCDAELNPPEVRDLGQVITEIGVAIVRPAEFVIFRIAQFSGPSSQ